MAKILLVEDDEVNRDMLARRLRRKGHLVVTAGDGERAVSMAGSESPDVILMDLNLPVLDGWMATRRLKNAPQTQGIPVIALTAHAMSGDRQKALNAGCDDYDTKPVEFERLMDKIQALLGTRVVAEAAAPVPSPVAAPARATPRPAEPAPRKSARLLVVDDTPANREMLARRLQRQGYEVEVAPEGQAALRMLQDSPFDLVLLDVMMPGINGLDVLRTLRETKAPTELPVIMATAKDESHDIVEALELGANDYVTKPLDFPVVLARVKTQLSLKHAVEQIRELEKGLEQRNAALQVANSRMREDLDAAARVQEALLPVGEPDAPGYHFGWRFKPSAWVAGDILNVFRLDDRHVGLYLLDVSGHGVAAALLSVTVSRFLSPARDAASLLWQRDEATGEYRVNPPARVAARLADRFPFDDRTGQYFTLVYGLLDVRSHAFRYVSAGHPPVALVPRGGAAAMAEVTGYPIGVSPEPYDEHEITLAPGERLYVYSDGVPESMDDRDEQFGAERLLQQLLESRGETLDGSLTTLLDRIDHWRGAARVHDDLSVLALERNA
jgi:sigma-B regulation protein RsbU (phosphoserine phosphatase)